MKNTETVIDGDTIRGSSVTTSSTLRGPSSGSPSSLVSPLKGKPAQRQLDPKDGVAGGHDHPL